VAGFGEVFDMDPRASGREALEERIGPQENHPAETTA
jgi:hypothetical protein